MPIVEFEIQGPEAPLKKVRRTLDSEPLWIGRDDSCQLVLPAASVSRRHVALRWRGDQLEVTDFSSNGTLVNDALLRKASRRFPPHGVRLVLGPFALRVRSVDEGADSLGAPSEHTGAPPPKNANIDRPTAVPEPNAKQAQEHLTSPLLRRRIHRQLLDHLDLPKMDGKLLNDPTLRDRVIVALRRIVVELDKEIPAAADREVLILELTNEALGLGPLEGLLDDPDVSEIMVVDPQTIFAERRGRIVYTGARFTDNESVRAAIERIVTPLGRRIDESTPLVDARLKDGSRVNAVIPPLAVKGPCITIRKFAKTPLVIEDLIRFGSMTPRLARFLTRAVRIRKNIVISGGTGSGKTTLLNVLSGAIPEAERVVTIEDAAELQLAQPHVVSLESRPPNLEGRGEYSIRDLVKNALRMRPDRIVVGECRGGEAVDMLQAMNTGHEGSMTTTHANSPKEAVSRIETLCLMAGVDLPIRAIRAQIAASIHLVVQQSRLSDGSRRVTNVAEVVGIDDDGDVELHEIFSYVRTGTGADGKVIGEFRASGYLPSFVDEFIAHGIAPDGDFV
jgi:pilus assembly protein CpaF